jgi:hypothetical protein
MDNPIPTLERLLEECENRILLADNDDLIILEARKKLIIRLLNPIREWMRNRPSTDEEKWQYAMEMVTLRDKITKLLSDKNYGGEDNNN